jgi:hypothetical protein
MDVALTKKEREAIRLAFGDLVRKHRHKLGISQEECAADKKLDRKTKGISNFLC